MTDAETSAAIEWLTRSLRDRDTAIRDGEEYADAEVFAAEVFAAMRGHGWRPTAAKAYAAPKPAQPAAGSSHREELLAPLRAQLDDLNAARQAAREDGAA